MYIPSEPVIPKSLADAVNNIRPGMISPVSGGRRRVSITLLSSPDASSSSSSAASSVFSAASASSSSDSATIELPDMIDSATAVVWIGFETKTADYIINKWLAQEHTTELPLRVIIERYLRSHQINEPCSNANEGNWNVAMRQLGISGKMQEAVMDPEFDFIRAMHPLRHWLEEFVVSNFLSLSNMEHRIRTAIEAQNTPLTPSLRGGAGDSDRADYEKKPGGYVTLYRATTAGRLKEVFVDDDKTALARTMPGPNHANDFGWDNYGILYYWTSQMWVADVYASYCKRAIEIEWDVCILKMIARPWDIRVDKATWELEYGDMWRKLIWHSRNRKDYPAEIEEKHQATKVFIGPISGNATQDFRKMDTWESVSDKNILKQNGHGEGAIQYVWKGNAAMSAMDNKCQIDLFRWPAKRWLRDPKTWVAGR